MDRLTKAVDAWIKYIEWNYLPTWLSFRQATFMLSQICLGELLMIASFGANVAPSNRAIIFGAGLVLGLVAIGIIADHWLAYLAEAAILLGLFVIVSTSIAHDLPGVSIDSIGTYAGLYLFVIGFWFGWAGGIVKLFVKGFSRLGEHIQLRRETGVKELPRTVRP
ncbi:MAG: hypothetical protein ABL962_00420 [Fimbriimonadaceae bacterium]